MLATAPVAWILTVRTDEPGHEGIDSSAFMRDQADGGAPVDDRAPPFSWVQPFSRSAVQPSASITRRATDALDWGFCPVTRLPSTTT